MSREQFEEYLRQGIVAARSNNVDTARRFLREALKIDPRSELGWIWLATVATNQRERETYLQKVLEINPNNARARQALTQIAGERANAMPRPTSAAPAPQRRTGSNNRGVVRLALLSVLGIAMIGVITLAVINLSNSATPATVSVAPTQDASALEIPAVTNTPRPTLTPNYVVVTARSVPDLPPTFTPTATLEASPEPTSTPTVAPLPEYTLLIASRARDEVDPNVFVRQVNAGSTIALLDAARDVVYSPDGSWLAYTRRVNYPAGDGGTASSAYEVFIAPATAPADGLQVTELRTANAYTPAITNDGNRIFYISDATGNDELYQLNRETGATVQITGNPGIDRQPALSPDGRWLVFVSDQDSPGQSELYLLNIESGFALRRLTDYPGNSFAPGWSPDSREIVYANDRNGDSDLYIVSVTGDRNSALFTRRGSEEFSPVFSPDGLSVFFTSNMLDDRFQAYRYDTRTRTITRLTDDNRAVTSLAVQPAS